MKKNEGEKCNMFNNVGKKLKWLAVFCTIAGAFSSIVYGAILMYSDSALLGFLVIIIGALISWLSSLLMYGVGELNDNGSDYEKTIIEKLDKMEKQIEQMEKQTTNRAESTPIELSQQKIVPISTEPAPEGMWRCGRCGSLNEDGLTGCKYCGTEK